MKVVLQSTLTNHRQKISELVMYTLVIVESIWSKFIY